MSDDEDDEYGHTSHDDLDEDFQNNTRVYHVLRDFCDVPKLEMQSKGRVLLPRHGTMKAVVVLATLYHVYLFKRKGMKLYIRWPARYLTVCRRKSSVYFSNGIDADTVADEHEAFLKKTGGASASRRKSHHSDSDDDPHDDDDDDDTQMAIDWDQEKDTFNVCRVVLESESSAVLLMGSIEGITDNAVKIAQKHKAEEEGLVTKKRRNVTFKDDSQGGASSAADDEQHESGDSDTGEDDDVDDAQIVLTRTTAAMQAAASSSTKMLRSAPNRYIAVASLVDGEFADYTALKNAYLRNEDGSLLEDLKNFIVENEFQVESVCRQHYPAFLHAARQCTTITQSDAETVRDELSGATRLVRDAAVDMKSAASSLLVSKSVRDHMIRTRDLLEKLLAVAECLEAAESQIGKDQLLGAATSLSTMTKMASSFSEYAACEYMLHRCLPRLHRRIVAAANGHLNKWLGLLRTCAAEVGREVIAQSSGKSSAPRIVPGKMRKRAVVSDDDGGTWSIVVEFVPSSMISSATSTTRSALERIVPDIIHGASVQHVFAALGQREHFRALYADARWRQFQSDLLSGQRNKSLIQGAAPMDAIRDYCHAVLGTMLTEDMVVNATKPFSVQSPADLIRVWDLCCVQINDLVVLAEKDILGSRSASGPLPGAVSSAGTESGGSTKDGNAAQPAAAAATTITVRSFLEFLTDVGRCARANVMSAVLNPIALTRIAERIASKLQSSWVEDCSIMCANAVMSDTLAPIPVTTPQEFQSYVARFHLHRATKQDLPVQSSYRAGSIALPYALFVPTIGDRVLSLVTHCYESHGASEVNNFDDMMLEYLTVVFRAANGALKAVIQMYRENSPLQLSLLITSCAAMGVVISVVEMEFAVRCSYAEDDDNKQVLGQPKLLGTSAQLFSQLSSNAIDQLSQTIQNEITGILKPLASFAYWKQRVQRRKGGGSDGGALKSKGPSDAGGDGAGQGQSAMDALLEFVDKRIVAMKSLLQLSVLKALTAFLKMHVISTCQQNIDRAVDVYHEEQDMTLMRDVVAEFRREATEGYVKFVMQLEKQITGTTAAATGGGSAPAEFERTATMLIKLIEAREMEIAEEKAKNMLLEHLDAAKAAGVAVVQGVADAGRATGRNILRIGKNVASGVVGGATPKSSTDSSSAR